MKADYSSLSSTRQTNRNERFTAAGFSRRLARPSITATVSSLNSSLRIDDIWDSSFLDRLSPPLVRRHY